MQSLNFITHTVYLSVQLYYHGNTGTHGLSKLNHNVFDASSSGRSITASCDWDTAFENIITGCLLVIVPDIMSEVDLPQYKITQTRVQANVTISGLSSNAQYKASLFEMLGTPPYPVRYPAVTESFLLTSGQQSPNEIEGILNAPHK